MRRIHRNFKGCILKKKRESKFKKERRLYGQIALDVY